MIPVARRLVAMDQNVLIASGREHLGFFMEEMPGLTYIDFPGFRPLYSKYLPQYVALLFKTPLLVFHIFREHYRLRKLISTYKIDVVISDNRFGLWNRKITSVYVTHMPRIPFPAPFRFLEFAGIALHRSVIKRYDFCLIPDLPGDINLTGRLTHSLKLPVNTRFVGVLSRFPASGMVNSPPTLPEKHAAVILSGPEPQRTVFREKLVSLLPGIIPVSVILEGRPGSEKTEESRKGLIFRNHLRADEMETVLRSADLIVSRAGYSTIMDLVSMKRTALLVPTPGQTEQEYLAGYLSLAGWFCSMKQKQLKPGIVLPEMTTGPLPDMTKQSNELLGKALSEILDKEYHEGEPDDPGQVTDPHL
jgi:hypothetical protein